MAILINSKRYSNYHTMEHKEKWHFKIKIHRSLWQYVNVKVLTFDQMNPSFSN